MSSIATSPFRRSTASRCRRQALPFDQNEGAGFWWANCRNTFTRNVACENDRYGYRFEATETSALKMTLPVMQPDGERKPTDIRTLPFVRFEDNESHCEGLYDFNLGEGVNRVGPDTRHPFIVRRTEAVGHALRLPPGGPVAAGRGHEDLAGELRRLPSQLRQPRLSRSLYRQNARRSRSIAATTTTASSTAP